MQPVDITDNVLRNRLYDVSVAAIGYLGQLGPRATVLRHWTLQTGTQMLVFPHNSQYGTVVSNYMYFSMSW